MKQYEIVVTVRGRGEFPVDMLRYDGLHPWGENDSYAVRSTFYSPGGEVPTLVHLRRWAESRSWMPTDARWRSFGWEVFEVRYTGRTA